MYSQIYACNVDRNNSTDGEREANTDPRDHADTAPRETYYNPDIPDIVSPRCCLGCIMWKF